MELGPSPASGCRWALHLCVLRWEAFIRLHPGITEQAVEGGLREFLPLGDSLTPEDVARQMPKTTGAIWDIFQKHHCVLKIRGACIIFVSE